MKKSLMVIMGILVMLTASAMATSYYVSVDGDDENGDGSQSNPWQTIQNGIYLMDDYDSLIVVAGIYQENINFLGKNVVVKSESGPEVTVLENATSGMPIVSFDQGVDSTSVISGFTIQNSTNCGILCDEASPKIENNIIQNNTTNTIGAGIKVNDAENPVVIRNNVINGNNGTGGEGQRCGGLYLYNVTQAIVDSNVFYNNTGYDGSAIGMVYSSVRLRYNSIYDNTATGGGGSVYVYGPISNTYIENNTIMLNTAVGQTGGIYIYGVQGSVNITNNIISLNSNYGIRSHSSSGVDGTYNCFYENASGPVLGFTLGDGNIYEDPLLTSPYTYDFSLTALSPCIDAGDPNTPLDPDSSRADIGAISYLNLKLDIGNALGQQGEQVELPVYISGFSEMSVAGIELHVDFNTDCLEYIQASSEYLTDVLINQDNGVIHILWDDFEAPLMFDDNAELLTIEFTILAEYSETCIVSWGEDCEIVDTDGEPYQRIILEDGTVTSTAIRTLSGEIIYYDQANPVDAVDIYLTGEQSVDTVTNEDGEYSFVNLNSGNYTIIPAKDSDDSGVTVNDIVLIRRHIVQLEVFDSGYKYLAADVNESGGISVADVIKLRRYLADLEDLPSGNWAFISASYAIDSDNWFDAPRGRDTVMATENIEGVDFVGVRLGDVDASFGAGVSLLACLDDSVSIVMNSVDCRPGERVSMPVTVTGFREIAGIEIHISYPLEAITEVSLNSEVIEPTANTGEGNIHLIWDDIFDLLSIDDNDEIITLDFTVAEDAPDTIDISFTGSYICDEDGANFIVGLYDGQILTGTVDVDDPTSTLPVSYQLNQNYPNPFNANTEIEFHLPSASAVKLIVYDIQGREIEKLLDCQMPAGIHHVNWNASGYPSGIYLYKLSTGEFTQAKKMLLLK